MSVDELRRKIDAIDEQIVRLLTERAETAVIVGEEKRRLGIPVQNVERENQVLERAKKLNKGPGSDKAVQTVYRSIIDMCLEVQARSGPMSRDGKPPQA